MSSLQFSDVTNGQGIAQDISYLTGADFNKYPLNDRARNVNQWYSKIWETIFEAYGGWLFMDNNVSDTSTGIPSADQTMTSGTSLYGLPSAALTVRDVSILTSSGGVRQQLKPLSFDEFIEMGGDAYFSSNGVPSYYILQGDVIRLLPTPNVTKTSDGIRVNFDQDISTFAGTDTTKVPGFASPFHRMLSLGASIDYYRSPNGSNEERVKSLSAEYFDIERRLKLFYSKRYYSRFPHRVDGGVDILEELGV